MFREMMIDLDHIDLKYQRVIRMFLIIYGAFISYVFMEICFIFMVGDLAALSIRYNQFLILKQSMSHNYDRLADKQNQYAHDTAYKNKIIHTPSSNKVLRKNLDNNMGSRQDQKYSNMDKYIEKSAKGRQKQKQIGVSKELNQNNVSRKQNARTRGFDIHVTNIQNINDKITSLLGMIKKDKANLQKSQKQKQRTFMKGNQSSPNTSLIDRIKKQKMISSYDKDRLNDRTQSYKNFKEREERIADKQSKSVHKIRDFNVLEVVQEQTKQKQQTNAVRGRYYYDQQPKRDYSQLKYKRSTENNQIKKSNWRQKMLKQSISIAQYPIINQSTTSVLKQYRKIDNKPFQNIDQPSKKQNKFNDISEMYQQKRNQRMRNRNEQNLKFHKSIRQDTNLDTFQRNKMISKDASITNSIYQAYSIQTYQDMEQQQLTTKPQFCQDYMPIDLNKEDNIKRNDKINTTTKIIDDQIKRIKSKIQQSQQNNSKLKQKFRQNKQEEFTSNSKRYYDNSNRSKNQKSSPGRRQKQNISRMALKLSDQAEIDLRLKSARQYFQKYNNENKWDQLKYQIDKKGLNMNTNHLKQIMKMASDQHNPFSNSKGQQIKIQKIAQLLYEAQQHWQHQIYKKVPMRHLKEQNIQISDLDLNKKGYLNIEDVVCFINLYSGQFYRNRDISLIFRRLQLQSGQPAAKISYNSFLKVLTN